MLLKKALFTIVFLAVFNLSTLFGAPISQDLAEKVAKAHLAIIEANERLRDERTLLPPYSLISTTPLFNENNEILAYIATLSPAGYIVVSSDTEIRPIIAYSLTGEFSFMDSPDNALLHLLQLDMENRLQKLPFLPDDEKNRNETLWKEFLSSRKELRELQSITPQWGPYTSTHWEQGEPYNRFCPIDPYTGYRSWAGCVTIAVAQILGYWEYPISMSFDESDRYLSQSRYIRIDEDHYRYDFPSFEELNSILSYIDYDDLQDIAALIFAVGIRLRIRYSSSSSESYDPSLFRENYGYASGGYGGDLDEHSLSTLEIDMKQGRPAYFSFSTHAVVVDGYKETGEFHVNYGWGGINDGWYFLSSLGSFSQVRSKIYPYESSDIYYVDCDVEQSKDGLSWATAFKTIDEALEAAVSGDEIWVKRGTYFPDTDFALSGVSLSLYGGFAGNETRTNQRDLKNNVTVIDRQKEDDDPIATDGSQWDGLITGWHREYIIDGFTLTGFNRAVRTLYNSKTTISNCNFIDNELAISNESSYTTISNCVFIDNNSSGAIRNDGHAETGHGKTVIDSCLFLENNSYNEENGGAIGISDKVEEVSINNCVFSKNSGRIAGAICIGYDGSGDIKPQVTVTNCTFSENSAGLGGGIYCDKSITVVTNSILWGNSPSSDQIYVADGSTIFVDHSNIQGGFEGIGNIDADPLFANAEENNFSLKPDSPCIDAGDNSTSEVSQFDIEGKPRMLDGNNDGLIVVDMGAYESGDPDGDGFRENPNWVTVSGSITYSDTPLCSMVLANGQYAFSCGDDLGVYDLDVPLDHNGEITLYGFSSGFEPFKTVITPDKALNYDITLTPATAGRREMNLSVQTEPGMSNPDYVRVYGTVKFRGSPLCAMVLANGQNMFSCGADLGIFDLEVPLDGSGRITFYAFCSGFSPHKEVFVP